ncbi:Uncharacterised protein [Yersinia frederiksenii]|jgi:hypothetical protein|nr:Uncharacterised protein [Yersinia frederiksenii]
MAASDDTRYRCARYDPVATAGIGCFQSINAVTPVSWPGLNSYLSFSKILLTIGVTELTN